MQGRVFPEPPLSSTAFQATGSDTFGKPGHTETHTEPGYWTSTLRFYHDPNDPYNFLMPKTPGLLPKDTIFASRAEMERLELERQTGGEEPKEPECTRLGIHNSTKRRASYEYTLSPAPQLQASLGIKGPHTVHHRLIKNSPLNGVSYFKERAVVKTVTQALSASLDRESPHMHLGRRVEDRTGKGYCYTGRCETESKMKESISMMFLAEFDPISQRGRGIQIAHDGVYELSFCINSLLTTSAFDSSDRNNVIKELKTLKKLKGQIIEVENPITHQVYRVRIGRTPFFTREFNFNENLEKMMPDDLNGVDLSKELSKDGLKELEEMAAEKIRDWSALNCFYPDPRITAKIKLLQDTLIRLRTVDLLPEQELMLHALVCHLLDLPFITHCKSSVDRTGVAIAIICALHQYLEDGYEIPLENGQIAIEKIMQTPIFKEFFFENLKAALPNTEFSRGELGFKFGTQHDLNAIVVRLLPERLIKANSWQDIKNDRLGHKVFSLILTLAGAIAVFRSPIIREAIADWVRRGKEEDSMILRGIGVIGYYIMTLILTTIVTSILTLGGILTTLVGKPNPFLGLRFIWNLHQLIPQKIINRDHPEIREAHLLYTKQDTNAWFADDSSDL